MDDTPARGLLWLAVGLLAAGCSDELQGGGDAGSSALFADDFSGAELGASRWSVGAPAVYSLAADVGDPAPSLQVSWPSRSVSASLQASGSFQPPFTLSFEVRRQAPSGPSGAPLLTVAMVPTTLSIEAGAWVTIGTAAPAGAMTAHCYQRGPKASDPVPDPTDGGFRRYQLVMTSAGGATWSRDGSMLLSCSDRRVTVPHVLRVSAFGGTDAGTAAYIDNLRVTQP